MKQVIGILGGMGPRATVRFEQLLLDRLIGGDQALPTIVTINDGAIPDRSDYLLGKGPSPVPRMQHNLSTLEKLGATIVCIPCNTACAAPIFGRLQTNAKLLNLPAEVESVIGQISSNRVAILATKGTIDSGVYQAVCENTDNDYWVPDALTQKRLTNCIALVKAGRMFSAQRQAASVARATEASGCDLVILGCTELPLIRDALIPPQCIAVDTLEVLANACAKQVIQGDYNDARPIYA